MKTNEEIERAIQLLYGVLDYARLGNEISNLHNCNDCGNKDCWFSPKPGQVSRFNCPLWVGKTDKNRPTGIVIPGVSLPRNCHECGAFGISDVVGLEDECPVAKKTELFDFQERPEGCPLVEVKNENN